MADYTNDWFGMLVAMLLLCTLILVIYACCNHFTANPSAVTSVVPRRPVPRAPSNEASPTNAHHHHGQRSRVVEYQMEPTTNPQELVSPFVFLPPAYDTLPKDPPKYEEIYFAQEGPSTGNGGEVNTGFQPDVVITTANSERVRQTLDSQVAVINVDRPSNQSQTSVFINTQSPSNSNDNSSQSQACVTTSSQSESNNPVTSQL